MKTTMLIIALTFTYVGFAVAEPPKMKMTTEIPEGIETPEDSD